MDHDVLKALPVAVYTTDANGAITFYNEAAAALWGHRPVLGSSQWCGSWRLFWVDGRPMRYDECPMAIALREGRTVLGMEAVAERPDGTRVVFTPYPTPIKDDAGRVTGGINVLVDITERKSDEMEAARLAAIVASSDDAIISKTLDGVVTSWNNGAERIYGYRPEEMIGRSIRTIIPPELQAEEDNILARLRRGERVEHFETERIAKDGSKVDVSITVSPVRDGRGSLVGASKIARDITERKQSEQLQRLLFNELNHRVKNTLATIQSIAGQSMRTAASPGAFVDSFNGRVNALARAHDLLVEQQMKGTSIGDLVREQVVLGTAEGTRVHSGGPEVMLDSQMTVQLALVLHELATNARKYGALSVATGALSITWNVDFDRGPQLHLTWQESGVPGVNAPQSRGFGTTLIERCLHACQGEASLHFGAEGLTCTIELPLPDKERASSAGELADTAVLPCEAVAQVHRGKRLLLVEDEPLIAMEMESELQSHGFEVVGPAPNLERARNLIAQERISAALLDANLGGDPVDTLAMALAQKGIPFAFATGYGRDALPVGFKDADIIPKPFESGRLVAAVHHLLNSAAQPEKIVPMKSKAND